MTKQPGTVTYRLAVEDEILALFKEVAPEIPVPLDKPETEENMVTEIVQCRGSTWVAVDANGKVVGFALSRRDNFASDRATALKYIGVAPSSRGLGVSPNLISKLKTNNIPLTASVLSSNTSDMAGRFLKSGFKQIASDTKQKNFRWDPPKNSGQPNQRA